MFELSPHTDKNKIFLVNLSDIEGVLSPLFFKSKPKFLEYNQKLKKIANVNPVRNKPKFNDDDLVPYVGLPETNEHTRKIVNVVLRPYKEVKGRNIIYPNDILFARIEPSIFNQKYIYADNLKGYDFAFTSTEFYIIEQKSINIQYIFHLLFSDYVFNQIRGKTTGSTGRRRLDLDAFKNIEIPVLPPQQKIIDLYENAFQEKQQKEAEAEHLLNSIDDYLLGELSIELPEKDNSLENRMYKVNFSEISGGRFDAFYYQTYFKQNIINIENGNYETAILKNIIEVNLIKGKLPNNDEKNGENKVIQIGSIDNNGNIDFEDLLTAKNIFSEEQKLKRNDVIIVITGATIGKTSFWDYEGDYYLGGDLIKFQTKESINPFYIFSILRTKPYQIEIERNVTGATNGHLSPTDIEHFPIPIPPIEKQNEIAEHIKAIREQAKRLKAEAKEVLEQAKQEVEKMILGEL